MQVNLDVVGGGAIPGGWDLIDNVARNNSVRLTEAFKTGAYVSGIDYSGAGSGTPYLDGTKNLSFIGNAYTVPDTDAYWFNAGAKSWAQWQALLRDVAGTRTIA